jgi:hypothetical protein
LPHHLFHRVQDGYLALAMRELQLFESGFQLVQSPDNSGGDFPRLGPIA